MYWENLLHTAAIQFSQNYCFKLNMFIYVFERDQDRARLSQRWLAASVPKCLQQLPGLTPEPSFPPGFPCG